MNAEAAAAAEKNSFESFVFLNATSFSWTETTNEILVKTSKRLPFIHFRSIQFVLSLFFFLLFLFVM